MKSDWHTRSWLFWQKLNVEIWNSILANPIRAVLNSEKKKKKEQMQLESTSQWYEYKKGKQYYILKLLTRTSLLLYCKAVIIRCTFIPNMIASVFNAMCFVIYQRNKLNIAAEIFHPFKAKVSDSWKIFNHEVIPILRVEITLDEIEFETTAYINVYELSNFSPFPSSSSPFIKKLSSSSVSWRFVTYDAYSYIL